MPSDPAALAGLAALVLAAAVLYSSVGHAGASAYLAAMALFGVTPAASKPAALVMNVAVATVVTLRFGAEGLVPWRRLLPLVLGSVPAAFVGGFVALPTSLHRVVLGALLAFAGLRLLWAGPREIPRHRAPADAAFVAMGAAIGFFAGLTGVSATAATSSCRKSASRGRRSCAPRARSSWARAGSVVRRRFISRRAASGA